MQLDFSVSHLHNPKESVLTEPPKDLQHLARGQESSNPSSCSGFQQCGALHTSGRHGVGPAGYDRYDGHRLDIHVHGWAMLTRCGSFRP